MFGQPCALLLYHFAFALDRFRDALKVAFFERTFSSFVGGIEVGLQRLRQRISGSPMWALHVRSRFLMHTPRQTHMLLSAAVGGRAISAKTTSEVVA